MKYFSTGLSNHCKLEVVECDESVAQTVKIALQLEVGGRIVGEYSSEDTLDKLIAKAKDKLEGNVPEGHEPVIIYMRQEIIGKDAISSTSFKKLGLTGGSAVLRLIHRIPETLSEQANVVNIPPPSVKVEKTNEKDNWRPMRKEEDDVSLKMFEKAKEKEDVAVVTKHEENPVESMDIEEDEKQPEQKNVEIEPPIVTEKASEDNVKPSLEPLDNDKVIETIVEPPVINVLDEEHNTVIYKLSDQSARIRSHISEVSDDFFDLTIEDAKVLLRDARKVQKEADPEGQVLMTEQMRQAQKEGQKLALLNKYRRAVIRVQLPDRHVVQGFYLPGETLEKVVETLRQYLKLPNEIELFITPPKQVLDAKQNLLDLGLVPAALVYLSAKSSHVESFLPSEMTEKLSNANGAEQVLSEARILKKKGIKSESVENDEPVQTASNSGSAASSSGVKYDQAVKRPPTTASGKSGNTKVPRWFKPSK